MNVLFFEWNALMQQDLEYYLAKFSIPFRRFSYTFSNLYEDDFFENRFGTHLSNHQYDLVISFNYYPLVSKVCLAHNLTYLSWCYDSPVRLSDYCSFANPNNVICMFDKKEVAHFNALGFSNVYHMPLAINIDRLNRIPKNTELISKYQCEVSFVGNLHHGNMEQFLATLPEYEWGYVKALVNAQLLLSGIPVTDLIDVDEIITRWNPYFRIRNNDPDYSITKEDFLFLFGQYATEIERKTLLSSISAVTKIHCYSSDYTLLPSSICYQGTADYYTEMPYIFLGSKINLNPTFRCIQSGISLRVLDIMGMGGFLLTNAQPELFEYFENGKHFAAYENPEHALDLIDYFLSHDTERKTIANAGKIRCQEYFSYDVQLKRLLEIAFPNE